jgi:hypothetical protein
MPRPERSHRFVAVAVGGGPADAEPGAQHRQASRLRNHVSANRACRKQVNALARLRVPRTRRRAANSRDTYQTSSRGTSTMAR